MSKKVPRIEPTRANRPRNAFDLSQKHLFTVSPGMLLPVMCLDLMPHDHVEIQATDFMRAMPMNSAAFISMRGVYEFFFVPYSHMWHGFDQFITGMSDYKSFQISSVFNGTAPKKVPAVHFGDLAKEVVKNDSADIFGFKNKYNVPRLLDMLGYGRVTDINGDIRSEVSSLGLRVTPFRLAAYQKIYYDFYRNTTYEAPVVSQFNFDDYSSDFSASEFYSRFCHLRYRNAQTDFFTNVRPSPLFTDPTITSIGEPNFGAFPLVDDGTLVVAPQSSHVSVADIRNAFALDKLLSITMRAGKTYAEQIKAHFGVDVSEGRDGRCHYIGGFDSDVQVGDVTQQSGTTVVGADARFGGFLGRTVGKATASGSGRVVYDAKEHGILMCIYSLIPDMQYDSTRVDPFVYKQERSDFFIPEFENLGMQPLTALSVTDKGNGHLSVLGYQPRYSEYKTALDINHGQFIAGAPLEYWSVGRSRAGDTLNTFNIASLKINPRWINDVFAVNYNGKELTDSFFGGCTFRVQKVSDMSEDGMPRV